MQKFWQVCPYLMGAWIIACPQSFTLAQVIPDNTLGAESSVITNLDQLRERIDGGALRGSNLFHSFLEFNVGEGRGVYFSNPVGIENILSRVTGGNASHILGRLGVLGGANLFLINPSGIVFGANASLDIQGSFFATTANGIKLGENGFFSATEPHKSNLLSVSPGVLFFNQVANQAGNIINRGNLAVGKDLTLAAGNLDLQGQLFAGGDLTLQGLNTVQIRDTVTNPFVAAAVGDLLVQGNQSIDIFALNHPDSGLVSGGDMVLRSANTVGGDSHYWSGGSFQIEQLDGSLGGLLSTEDPVIRSLGDVKFDSYIGTSLHILAAGSVEIPGFVQITGADPVNGIVETVTLSDGTTVNINGRIEPTLDIRAGVDPSVVGGFFFNRFDYFPFNPNSSNGIFNPTLGTFPTFTPSPTSADIKIGTILFADFLRNPVAGKVFLTNQYQPNSTLTGNIQVSATLGGVFKDLAISTGDFRTSGGRVAIDSKGEISIKGDGINSVNGNISSSGIGFSLNGNGGNITFLAKNNINLSPNSTISSIGLLGGNITLKTQGDISLDGITIQSESHSLTPELKGGNIDITANSLSLTNSSTNATGLSTRTWGRANGGDVNINLSGSIKIDGSILLPNGDLRPTGIVTNVGSGANADAGNINITAGSLSLTNGAQILSGVNSAITTPIQLLAGQGNAGKISIDVGDAVTLDGVRTFDFVDQNGKLKPVTSISQIATNLNVGTTGRAGDIVLKADSLSLTNGGRLTSSTFGLGNSGDITIEVIQNATLAGGGIQSNVESEGKGKAGNINFMADSLSLIGGGQITSGIRGTQLADGTVIKPGEGNGGDITIKARDITLSGFSEQLRLVSGVFSPIESGARGIGGNIKIEADNSLTISDFAAINSTLGVNTTGRGGNINIKADSLSLENGARILASTLGKGEANSNELTGNAGNITIQVQKDATLASNSGIQSNVETGGKGNAGNIHLTADFLSLTSGGALTSFVREVTRNQDGTVNPPGEGNGGNITVKANNINVEGFFFTPILDSQGNLILDPQGNPIASSFSSSQINTGVGSGATGNLGTINLTVDNSLTLKNGGVIISDLGFNAVQQDTSKIGDIAIKAKDILVEGNFSISTLDAQGNLIRNFFPSGIVTSVSPNTTGSAGNITLKADSLSLTNGGILTSSTFGTGDTGIIDITVDGDMKIDGGNQGILSAVFNTIEEGGVGNGKEVNITANTLSITNGGQIQTLVSRAFNNLPAGKGTAGDVNIDVSGAMNIEGIGYYIGENGIIIPSSSQIATGLDVGTTGSAGNITLKASSFSINNGGQLSSTTLGQGDAGDISVEVQGSVIVAGFAITPVNGVNFGTFSGISSNVGINLAMGNGGDVAIKAQSLTIQDFATLATGTFGQGNAGNVSIKVDDFVKLTNLGVIRSNVELGGIGNGGDIHLQARSLTLTDGSEIGSLVFREVNNIAGGQGKGGDIHITTTDFVSISGVSSVQLPLADPLDPSKQLITAGF